MEYIGVSPRGCSQKLQRALVDFGIEESFGKAAERVNEHYGVVIPASTIRTLTLKHAGAVAEKIKSEPKVKTLKGKGKKVIIAEIDGTMMPMVRTGVKQGSKRKSREVYWSEVRLSAARAQGSAATCYAVSCGDVDESGEQWAQAAKQAGWGNLSRIHAVGDGAPWIEKQSALQFGRQGNYLLDFYHVCEYLGEVAKESLKRGSKKWLNKQKSRLKEGEIEDVLECLKKLCREGNAAEKAYHYLEKRKGQLWYKEALEEELPIGSGMIEGGHRHVLQKRLKLSGAWWDPGNLEKMAALRVHRANNKWNHYWNDLSPFKAAA